MDFAAEVSGHWWKALRASSAANHVDFALGEAEDIFFLALAVFVDIEEDVEVFFRAAFPSEDFDDMLEGKHVFAVVADEEARIFTVDFDEKFVVFFFDDGDAVVFGTEVVEDGFGDFF